MLKYIPTLALSILTFSAQAQGWVKVSESNATIFYIQEGSLRITENDGGVRVVVAIGKTEVKETRKLEGVQWYVPISHCRDRKGKLVVTDTVGKFKSETDFVFGLGNVASSIAEIMCDIGLKLPATPSAPKSLNNTI